MFQIAGWFRAAAHLEQAQSEFFHGSSSFVGGEIKRYAICIAKRSDEKNRSESVSRLNGFASMVGEYDSA
jgi:hypothetical protein